ncbi:membrane protein [Stylonychia lemnae]|uniref:Membrane protein n=1 Tax=Stylonychia lemnae TaxID=5949 RepID=A0A078A3I4_STYLE|nr:membrane protein [Stylonychia lemnae]|eukprot:CDW76357.1 membrane protein [Stylonychia lemnae]
MKIRFQSVVGLLFMLVAVTLLSLSHVFTKQLFQSSSGINVLEVLIIRAIFQIVLNQILIQLLGNISYFNLTRDQIKKLLWRFGLGYSSWVMQIYTFNYLPLGTIQVIQNLTPFFSAIFGYIILRETLKAIEVVNTLISFSGVIFIVVLSSQGQNTHESLRNISQFLFIFSIVLNFISAVISSLVGVVIRQLRGVHFTMIAGFQGICSVIVSSIVLTIQKLWVSQEGFQYNMSQTDYVNALGLGIFGALSQICFVKALLYDKAGRCASLLLMNIVYGYLSDVLFFNYDIQIFEIVGSSVIIACSVVIFVIKCYFYND